MRNWGDTWEGLVDKSDPFSARCSQAEMLCKQLAFRSFGGDVQSNFLVLSLVEVEPQNGGFLRSEKSLISAPLQTLSGADFTPHLKAYINKDGFVESKLEFVKCSV